jgi:hypothetical protein
MAFGTPGSSEFLRGDATNGSLTYTEEGGGVYYFDLSVVVPSLGANRAGAVLVSFPVSSTNVTSIASVVFDQGGSNLTMNAGTVVTNGNTRVQCFYLLGTLPQNGTYTVRVRVNVSVAPSAGQVQVTTTWNTADNPILFDNQAQNSGSGAATATVTVPISAAGWIVTAAAHDANALAATPYPDGTLLHAYDFGGNCSVSGYSKPGSSGSYALDHDFSQTGTWSAAGLSFIEDGGGGPTVFQRIIGERFGLAGGRGLAG